MEKSTSRFKDIFLAILIICSWVLFPFVTFISETKLHFVPLLLLIAQIILLYFYKKKELFILLFLNPVIVFAVFYTIKPIINYVKHTPTIMKCCSNLRESPTFDFDKSVFMDYYDDDCDPEGLYYYTIDINNFWTNGLIAAFGNPIAK